MPVNRIDDKKTFWFFDENQLILERLPWEDNRGGKGDSVGRNAFAYICWPNQTWLKQTFMQCVKQRDDTFVQFYRYPNFGADTMSRDHVGGIILALYINRDYEELDWILNNLPFRLSRKYTQTIDFWLWQKSLKYRNTLKGSVFAKLFLVLNLLMFIFVIPYNWIIRKILGIRQVDFNVPIAPEPLRFRPKSFKWKLQKSIYPHFALFLLAWQILVIKPNFLRWLLQKLLLLESGNICIDAVLGKRMTKEKYESFAPLTSFVLSGRLDNTNDAYVVPNKPEDNDLNKGMLDYLYFGIDKIMLEYDDKIVDLIKNQTQIIDY